MFSLSAGYSQVGMGNNDPNGVLDLTNSTSELKVHPFVAPTKSGVDAEDNITNPSGGSVVAGSIFY
ncbi:MAG: hypothetical protein ACK5HU_00035, partial [Flavobacteriales bacterium]